MSTKIKRLLKWLHRQNLHHATLVVGILVSGGILCSLTALAQPKPLQIVTVKPTVSQQSAKKSVIVAKPVTPAPVATPTPAPVTTPKVVAVKPAVISPKVTVGTKTEPVVTASPSSSVSSLAPTSPSTPSSTPSAPATTTSYTSTNWSGYLATSGTYTTVSANWTVPDVSGNGTSASADGTWVGIGGVSTGDLIQAGTQDSVTAGGQVTTNAFYEILPSSSVTVYSITVSPGDSVSTSVVETSPSEWTITITDNTTAKTFTKTLFYTSTNSSAEWVEEDPSYTNGNMIPFDNFGTVDFSGISTTKSGSTDNLNTSNALPITMVNNANTPIATPSAIEGGGSSFSITHD
jgi:hypothetical protein